jgi:hypothetical protein
MTARVNDRGFVVSTATAAAASIVRPDRNATLCELAWGKRTNETYVSPTDPETKLYCMGHVLTDHREELAVDVEVAEANGYAKREAALACLTGIHPKSSARRGIRPTTPRTSLLRAASAA